MWLYCTVWWHPHRTWNQLLWLVSDIYICYRLQVTGCTPQIRQDGMRDEGWGTNKEERLIIQHDSYWTDELYILPYQVQYSMYQDCVFVAPRFPNDVGTSPNSFFLSSCPTIFQLTHFILMLFWGYTKFTKDSHWKILGSLKSNSFSLSKKWDVRRWWPSMNSPIKNMNHIQPSLQLQQDQWIVDRGFEFEFEF
jgi:hypothetical protein